MKLIIQNKSLVITGAFIITAVIILREYFNGGVITHYLLAREDLPGFSNWWGLLTIPLLSWIVVTLIQRRLGREAVSGVDPKKRESKLQKRFLAALLFGIICSLLWEFGLASVLQYFILLPLLVAFFRPIHLPEYLLGFVIGMLYSFGGVLPILIGLVLLLLCFLINLIIQFLRKMILSNSRT